jgi:hypothetical protein
LYISFVVNPFIPAYLPIKYKKGKKKIHCETEPERRTVDLLINGIQDQIDTLWVGRKFLQIGIRQVLVYDPGCLLLIADSRNVGDSNYSMSNICVFKNKLFMIFCKHLIVIGSINWLVPRVLLTLIVSCRNTCRGFCRGGCRSTCRHLWLTCSTAGISRNRGNIILASRFHLHLWDFIIDWYSFL